MADVEPGFDKLPSINPDFDVNTLPSFDDANRASMIFNHKQKKVSIEPDVILTPKGKSIRDRAKEWEQRTRRSSTNPQKTKYEIEKIAAKISASTHLKQNMPQLSFS